MSTPGSAASAASAASDAATVASASSAAYYLVQNFSSLQYWRNLPIIIILLMFQDIHPNIIYELLPNFKMSNRGVQDIILAMMQLRLFASFFILRNPSYQKEYRMIRQKPQHWITREFSIFRRHVFLCLLKRTGFQGISESTRHSVRDFISNFVYLRTNRSIQVPVRQLFLSSHNDLSRLKTACMLNHLIHFVRSSYPEIVSFLAQAQKQNASELQKIIHVCENQLEIKEIQIYGRRNHCYVVHSQNIIKHLMRDLFAFFFLAVIKPNMIDEKLRRYIQNFGDETELLRDPYNPEDLEFLKRNCKTEDMKHSLLQPCCGIGGLIYLFSLSSCSGIFNVKYELKPVPATSIFYHGDDPQLEPLTIEASCTQSMVGVFKFKPAPALALAPAPATSKFYRIDDPQFESLDIEASCTQSMVGVFKRLLEVFLKNSARTFEESGGGSALPP